jgi:hypothetical protein
MTCRPLLSIVAASLTMMASPTIVAAGLFTYRFDDGGERLFRYAGGLMGGGFDARLEGTFDIERDPSGAGTIVRFDVAIEDPLFHGTPSMLGDPTGKPLSDYLLRSPVGLAVSHFQPRVSPVDEPDVSTHPRTVISISDWDAQSAQLRLYSGYNLLLDAPASFTRDGGITVVQVPEPGSLIVILTGIAALTLARRSS